LRNAEVVVWPFTTMNLYWKTHASAQKITETAKSLKYVTYSTLIIFILRSYVDELK